MATQTPIVSVSGKHDVLPAGDTLALPVGSVPAASLSGTVAAANLPVATDSANGAVRNATAAEVGAGTVDGAVSISPKDNLDALNSTATVGGNALQQAVANAIQQVPGSEATTSVLGTVKYSDTASVVAGTGNKVVTDAILKYALGAGNSYQLSMLKPGEVARFASQDGAGFAVLGLKYGTGSSSALCGANLGAGVGGAAVYAETGLFGTNVGSTTIALSAFSGVNGTYTSAGDFVVAGANTTWGVSTNGAIFTAGGVTTSDKRLKENIEGINVKNAIALLDNINFVQYDKFMDKTLPMAKHNEQVAAATESLAAAKAELAALKKSGDPSRRAYLNSQVEAHAAIAEQVYEPTNKDLFVAKQAGVIAQDLQELTKKIGDFEYLVKLSNPRDEESILVVDYVSLDMILSFASREKMRGIEARLAKLGA